MTIAYTLVNTSLRFILRSLCMIDDAQLPLIPEHGPLILVANHINFLDVPILATHLLPRPLTAFAKSETWNNPFLGLLFTMWGAIPLHRGEADLSAFRKAEKALSDGKIMAIAPEGTRSGHGMLQRGHAGVVLLAQRTGAPLLPVVYYGNECFRENIQRLRRTNFHITVGKAFNITAPRNIASGERQIIADEIMYQLAMLLPEKYRGYYSDLSLATTRYISFSP
ncbi:MAG: 1-acyl-sn-glycerol-3-phosphate acyltransferase [Chloroflexi bacterium]|nr:1-acyl-sn-glycerol-3-phosphate acyltransferase [Chloroflexota bacterium]